MATKESFNVLVCEFLEDLSSTFDEHQCLQVLHTSLSAMIGENKSTPLPVCMFQSAMGAITPEAISDRTPVLLETLHKVVASLGLNIDVKSDYDSTDDATKDAIWEYIKNLHCMASQLAEKGTVDTVDMTSIDSIMASVSKMNVNNAESMMNSVMCLVPPGLKDFVDAKVLDCQRQIENGELSTEDIVDQIKTSMVQLN